LNENENCVYYTLNWSIKKFIDQFTYDFYVLDGTQLLNNIHSIYNLNNLRDNTEDNENINDDKNINIGLLKYKRIQHVDFVLLHTRIMKQISDEVLNVIYKNVNICRNIVDNILITYLL